MIRGEEGRRSPLLSTRLDTLLAGELGTGAALGIDALRRIAATIGHRAELWRDAAHHDEHERPASLLYRRANLDVWLICRLDSQDTGLHDHDRSSGAVHVCAGTLAEEVLSFEASGTLQVRQCRRPAGTTFGFGGSHIHGVHHTGSGPATSIHVYSPALLSMGHYEIGDGGGLERIVRSYAQGVAG
jgi:Cysteine dioxygenase type I